MGSRNASAWRAQERVDLRVVLGPEHRAGRVEEQPAGRQARPERVEQARLLAGEAGDVTGPPQPLAVGVPPDHARGGARHVDEDPVERATVPPVGGRARVAGHHRHVGRGELQAREVLPHPVEPCRLRVQRDDLDVGKLEQVGGLAARGGAGVEHPHPRARLQQRRGELRAQVLHGEPALAIARKLGDRSRRVDDDAGLARGHRADRHRRAGCEERLARGRPRVHAQRQRRALVAGGEDSFPVRRVVGAHAVDPPLRMRPARHRVGAHRRAQRLALAQVAPQQRVDQRLGGRARDPRRAVDRVVDDGERRRPRVIELVERDRDQVAQRGIGEGLRRQLRRQRGERAPVAQRAVGELLHQRATPPGVRPAGRLAPGDDGGQRHRQRRPVEHPPQHPRGLVLGFLHRGAA